MVAANGVKRLCSFEEELLLLDPHLPKRCRLEAQLGFCEEEVHAARITGAQLEEDIEKAVSAAAAALSGSACDVEASCSSRRRAHQEMHIDEEESEAGLPADKRLRQMIEADAAVAGGSSCSSGSSPLPSSKVRGWAEAVVRSLHGCPSVDAALERCSKALGDFGAEVQQAALLEHREAAARAEPEAQASFGADAPHEVTPEAAQRLKYENRVLRRAVHYLAQRCRGTEAQAQEAAALRELVEQLQEKERRLTHANEVLQGHLRVHLDGYRGGAETWQLPMN
jgi:hypothetical protein